MPTEPSSFPTLRGIWDVLLHEVRVPFVQTRGLRGSFVVGSVRSSVVEGERNVEKGRVRGSIRRDKEKEASQCLGSFFFGDDEVVGV